MTGSGQVRSDRGSKCLTLRVMAVQERLRVAACSFVCVQDTLEMCAREAEFKCILFALCYFHAVVCERRKFGPQGWNRVYPYNVGDLTISVNVLYNYLEANSKVPWEDLRYLFGEIMYGGHITDDWDRRLCRTYLEEYMNPTMVCSNGTKLVEIPGGMNEAEKHRPPAIKFSSDESGYRDVGPLTPPIAIALDIDMLQISDWHLNTWRKDLESKLRQ